MWESMKLTHRMPIRGCGSKCNNPLGTVLLKGRKYNSPPLEKHPRSLAEELLCTQKISIPIPGISMKGLQRTLSQDYEELLLVSESQRPGTSGRGGQKQSHTPRPFCPALGQHPSLPHPPQMPAWDVAFNCHHASSLLGWRMKRG